MYDLASLPKLFYKYFLGSLVCMLPDMQRRVTFHAQKLDLPKPSFGDMASFIIIFQNFPPKKTSKNL